MNSLPIIGLCLLVAAAITSLLVLLASVWWQRRRAVLGAPEKPRPISVLKPLAGAEPRLYENLRSFFEQDHPDYQLLFGLHAADDEALTTVQRLRAEFPQREVTVVIDDRVHGANLKVSNLINLLPQVRHDWLVLADSDIHAPLHLLRQITAPLADRSVGVVSCLYRGKALGGLWTRLGAQFIDDWFAPSVMLTRAFGGSRFSFGAAIALRRDALAAIGGFAPLADHVADDWWLGELTRREGFRTVLSECEVRTDVIETTLAELAARELRWLRSIRSIQPLGYPFTFLSFPTPIAVLGWLLADCTVAATILAAIVMILRGGLHLLQATRATWSGLLLVPIRDSLSLLLWGLALTGRVVRWRGRPMKIAAHVAVSSARQPSVDPPRP